MFDLRNQSEIKICFLKSSRLLGSGYLGYANIHSLDKSSVFFILNHNLAKVQGLLFIADNGCGDNYAFRIESGMCSEEIVFFGHVDHTIKNAAFSDVLEHLIKIGLHQSNVLLQ